MKKSSKILSFILVFSFLLGAVPLGAIMPLAANSDVSADLILKETNPRLMMITERGTIIKLKIPVGRTMRLISVTPTLVRKYSALPRGREFR